MLALPRADAAERAKIATRGTPSPRAYRQLVRRWARSWLAWATGALDAASLAEPLTPAPSSFDRRVAQLVQRIQQGAPPRVPAASEIAAVGRAAVRASIRTQHQALVAAGMPRAYLIGRLGRERAVDPRPAHRRRHREQGGRRTDERDKPKVAPVLSAPGVTRARGTVGIDLLMDGPGERVLVGWAQEGVDLISTLSRTSTQDLASLVVEAAAKGRRWEDLADAVAKMGARTEAHARLIARTETARLNSRVSEEMQTAAGIDRFRLRTSGDQRVRDEHAEAAERDIGYGPGIYRWSEGIPNFMGPQTGLPGAVPNCRCTGEPHVLQSTRDAWAKAADL